MTGTSTSVLSLLLMCFLLPSLLGAQGKNQETCQTPQCHASYGKAKFVHGPVAVGQCTPCHQPVRNEKHKFLPMKKTSDLCSECHEPMAMKAVVHAPVAKGQCTSCHDPHESNSQYQIKKAPLSAVCLTCHNKDIVKNKSVHGPVAEGDCSTCHEPHTSVNKKLLLKAGNDLCFECHGDLKDRFAATKAIHKPAAENCIQCHNPHSNTSAFMLASNVPEECYTCHKDVQQVVAGALVKHGALDIGKKCLNCHSPHEAQYARQLVDQPMDLCLHCHDKAVDTPTGPLSDMKSWVEKNKDWHGPIRERDCSGCHEVHGGQNFRILKKSYPKEFYAPFAQTNYELCFSCHQPTLVLDASTTTLTSFRDGDRNLHFLHVNKTIKGRTCRACHETHASQNPKHIREEVPFGKWMLPIRFEKKSNGGTCAPGCHAPKKYDRGQGQASKHP